MTNFFQTVRAWSGAKSTNLVELEKCCKMRTWTPKSASIQRRTDRQKFGVQNADLVVGTCSLKRACSDRAQFLVHCIHRKGVSRSKQISHKRHDWQWFSHRSCALSGHLRNARLSACRYCLSRRLGSRESSFPQKNVGPRYQKERTLRI